MDHGRGLLHSPRPVVKTDGFDHGSHPREAVRPRPEFAPSTKPPWSKPSDLTAGGGMDHGRGLLHSTRPVVKTDGFDHGSHLKTEIDHGRWPLQSPHPVVNFPF